MFPFSSSTPQPTARCRDLSRVQCSPFSTNHSTERNAVRDLTEREILLKKISTYEFAALDLQIYLDTHPHDTAMIQKMNGFKEKLKPLVEEYEEKFGPLKKEYDKHQYVELDKGTVAVGKRGGLLMFVYEKKLQYPVNIKKPNAKLAKIIITQYGGA